MPAALTVLEPELALAAEAAPPPQDVLALAGADPLRLDLPALPGARVAPDALRALSALYLAARLEETGLLVAADVVVAERAVLRVPPRTAARLEDAARRQQHDLPAPHRAALYARHFGRGADDAGTPGARFDPLLAAVCSALVAYAARADERSRVAVDLTVRDLGALAGTTVGGAAALVVAPISDQLRRAMEILGDPGIGALVGGRGTWETLRRLLGGHTPDLRRLIDCGRHGQRVLLWCAAAVAASGPISADVVRSAAAWLTACGLAVRGEGSV